MTIDITIIISGQRPTEHYSLGVKMFSKLRYNI